MHTDDYELEAFAGDLDLSRRGCRGTSCVGGVAVAALHDLVHSLVRIHCVRRPALHFDVLIASASLALAVWALGRTSWPENAATYVRVAGLAMGLGVAYTLISEWVNVELLGHWTYSPNMPRLPWLGTGLAPFVQWFVVPIAGFGLAARVCGKAVRQQD